MSLNHGCTVRAFELVLRSYRFVFGREMFSRWNTAVLRCALSGLGVLNFDSPSASGELRFLRSYLRNRPSPLVLDVGANVGGWSAWVRAANPTAEIHAFEPSPSAFAALERRGGVKALNVACGSTAGRAALFDYADHRGSVHASLVRGVLQATDTVKITSSDVDVIRLDDYLAQLGHPQVDLLKIDVEGNEFDVLLGAKASLEAGKIEAIQFEFNEMNVRSRVFMQDFLDLLASFELYRLLPYGRIRLQRYIPLTEIFAYQNVIALRREGHPASVVGRSSGHLRSQTTPAPEDASPINGV